MEDEEYWTKSETKAFSFDDDERTLPGGSSRRDIKLIYDDNVSEMSYELPAASSDVPLSALISDHDLQIVLEEQSLSDVQLRKGCPADEELRLLRRTLQDRYHVPAPATVIAKIAANKPVSLECWRALADKQALLDAACASRNTNAIVTVVLFVVRTLKRPLWLDLLRQRPDALRPYVQLLRQRRQLAEATQLLAELGSVQQLAMLHFGACMGRSYAGSPHKAERLRKVYTEYFQQPGVNKFYAQCVANYLQLLEWQAKEKTTNALALDLLDSPVLQTVYYACAQHKWSDPAGRYNPQLLVDQHRISAAQFEWVALTERARAHAWRDVEQLFEKKSWHSLKATTFQIAVPLERAIVRLHRLQAPAPVLNGFLARVGDSRRRLALARQLGVTKSVVDTLVEHRDRAALEAVVQSIASGTDVRFYAENALMMLRSKWNAENLKIRKS